MGEATDETDPAARLEDVVFAYEQGVDLPDAATFADDSAPDPDERGGPVLRGTPRSPLSAKAVS